GAWLGVDDYRRRGHDRAGPHVGTGLTTPHHRSAPKESPVRIVVVNNFFPPRLGGSSHMAAALAEQYVARGHEVLVLTAAYPGAPAEEEMHGFRVVRLPAMKMPKLGLSIDFDMTFVLARPGNVRRVTKILDAFKPDV